MADKSTEPVKKHKPTILDENGNYKNQSLAECNAEAYGSLVGSKRRQAASLKRIQETVALELKRA